MLFEILNLVRHNVVCFTYSAYGGGKSFPSHIVEYTDNHQTDDDQNWKSEARSAKRNQPQQGKIVKHQNVCIHYNNLYV